MARGLNPFLKKSAAEKQTAQDDDALSVSALSRRIKMLLEGSVGRISVTGEIGNLTRASSGHFYLALKDEHAVIDAVMWRSAAAKLTWEPAAGQEVIARGEVTVYEPRGRYQLVISSLKPLGKGELQLRFEALVKKLRAAGLFDPAHKKSLPALPTTIGLVTSPTGAAVRDMIKVLKRRLPGVKIVLAPCRVQGRGAADEISAALEQLDSWGKCEVIIVGRGGGSPEDLWAFNEEVVARTIWQAKTPIVSAVGHEVDLSIADLVADLRAATPSEAAENVVPDYTQWLRRVSFVGRGMTTALRRQIYANRVILAQTSRSLARQVMTQIREGRARIGFVRRSLAQAPLAKLREARRRLETLLNTTILRRPRRLIDTRRQQTDDAARDLHRAAKTELDKQRARFTLVAARLADLSPLAVLARGYSVTYDQKTGRIIHRADEVRVGDILSTRLAKGRVQTKVTRLEPEATGETKHGA